MSQQPPMYYGQPPKADSGSKTLIFIILGVVAVAGLCVVGILAALLIPAVMAAREAAARSVSMGHLKQIGVALHNYHDVYKAFPAAHVPGPDGKPRSSWRVALLPFIEQQAAFEKYDSNVPWDDTRNSLVRQMSIATFQSPRGGLRSANGTNYVVVTSTNHMSDPSNVTMFPGPAWSRFQDVKDGTSNTIAVVEIKNSDIEWSEPRDLDIESLSSDPSAVNRIDLQGGAVVLFGDASVKMLPLGTSLETLKALLTSQGGEQATSDF